MKLARRGVDDPGRGKNPNEKQCRRRRWSDADKRRIVSESLAPGSQVTEVARRNGVGREQLSVWRRQARVAPVAAAPMFALVEVERDCLVAAGPQGIGATSDGRIEIEIAGARVHVPAGADVGTLQNVVAVLRAVR